MARDIETVRKSKREHMARKRAADPEAARAYSRSYHQANREKTTAKMREYYERRFFWGRAMKLRGSNRATVSDISRLWYAQRGKCALTGRRLDRTAQLDHITPKAKGGDDCASNLRWVCAAINYAKRDMSDAELQALCADVMAWIGRRIAEVHS
jgi:CRISPR/Cas system Type II protein with McrA/HNH and RuvC-like nuclease domain